MGDPHEREFPVLLPSDYDESRSEPYPVAFFLAGWGSKSSKIISNDSALGESLRTRLIRGMDAGDIPQSICVFPDGSSKLGCSQYINSPAIGNYQDYICDELTQFIDDEFNTHASADYRAILGHSSGGFGALWAGFKRPDRFKFICSSAGDGFFELGVLPGIIQTFSELENAGGIEKFLSNFFEHPNALKANHNQIHALMTLNLCACYSPNTQKPPIFGDLFFDIETGELVEEVWKKFLEFDPVRAVDSHQKNIQALQFILLESGVSDEFGLQLAHRQLAKKFDAINANYELSEYRGKHGGHNWRYEHRLKLLLSKMNL